MLRIQAQPLAPSVPSPCCCPSSSSSSSRSSSSAPIHAGSSHLQLCAINSRDVGVAKAASSLSLRLDPLPDALRWRRRRRQHQQSRSWDSGSFPLSCCNASLRGGSSSDDGARQLPDWREAKDDDEFLQASLLVSEKVGDKNRSTKKDSNFTLRLGKWLGRQMNAETIRHYNLRKQGFFEETKWHSSGQILPLSLQANGSKGDVRSIGHGFLRRFQNPTIFLKIACDGDLLLPIIVGEFAIERLIDTLRGDRDEGSQSQFKFIKTLVGVLGYEVKMVRITKRVINTYYARIFLGKPAERVILSVDSRPSDAINVAIRCQAPIYVSKDIVLKDAIRIVYGTWRGNGVKTVYDVSLDSATEGPDVLSEELDLIKKMNTAVIEERYRDAAVWRDKLTKLRVKRHDL